MTLNSAIVRNNPTSHDRIVQAIQSGKNSYSGRFTFPCVTFSSSTAAQSLFLNYFTQVFLFLRHSSSESDSYPPPSSSRLSYSSIVMRLIILLAFLCVSKASAAVIPSVVFNSLSYSYDVEERLSGFVTDPNRDDVGVVGTIVNKAIAGIQQLFGVTFELVDPIKDDDPSLGFYDPRENGGRMLDVCHFPSFVTFRFLSVSVNFSGREISENL